jgi:hypothetical protein
MRCTTEALMAVLAWFITGAVGYRIRKESYGLEDRGRDDPGLGP